MWGGVVVCLFKREIFISCAFSIRMKNMGYFCMKYFLDEKWFQSDISHHMNKR